MDDNYCSVARGHMVSAQTGRHCRSVVPSSLPIDSMRSAPWLIVQWNELLVDPSSDSLLSRKWKTRFGSANMPYSR